MSSFEPAPRGIVLLGILIITGAAAGCQCNPGRYDVRVALEQRADEAGRLSSIEVNLVAVTDTELPRWSRYSVNAYFTPGDKLHEEPGKKIMQFGQGRPAEQALSRADPVWSDWKSKGARHLIVLAFLSGNIEDQEGALDPRRLILPLETCRWDGDVIRIAVRPGQIVCLSRLKP